MAKDNAQTRRLTAASLLAMLFGSDRLDAPREKRKPPRYVVRTRRDRHRRTCLKMAKRSRQINRQIAQR